MLDIKPMEAIYPNSLVHDIREATPESYSLVILGPNEKFPPRIEKSSVVLAKDTSIYINGLEYWRVYVKRSE